MDRNSPGKSIHPGIFVALHPEGVDRNDTASKKLWTYPTVALHPEGVDRNPAYEDTSVEARVALHPEGVDRNKGAKHFDFRPDGHVALHPEGVDRNLCRGVVESIVTHVALHPEGVDRNGLL